MGRSHFEHDIDSLADSKIGMLVSELGMEGYGLFWAVVEQMFKDECGIRAADQRMVAVLAHKLYTDKETLTRFLDYCVEIGLFVRLDDGTVTSPRAMNSVASYNAFIEKSRQGGRKSRR